MPITKIDKDNVLETRMVENIVNIPKLEDMLISIQNQKEEYNKVAIFKETLPVEFQPYLSEPPGVPQEEIDQLQDLITQYKEITKDKEK